jgi:hypothetical protein
MNFKKIILLFITIPFLFSCLLDTRGKDTWEIAHGIDNKCMLPRIRLNRETLYVIPYKLSLNEFNEIYDEYKSLDNQVPNQLFEEEVEKLSSSCPNLKIFLIEQYGRKGKQSPLDNYKITINGSEPGVKLSYKLNFYFYNGGFPSGPIVYFTDSPERVYSLYLREPPKDYNGDYLEKEILRREIHFYCDEKKNTKDLLKIESTNYELDKEEFTIPDGC